MICVDEMDGQTSGIYFEVCALFVVDSIYRF